MAILKAKSTTQMKGISVRIPADLHAELEAVKHEADVAGFSFSVTDVVTDALAKAARQARAELSAVVKQDAQQSVLQNAVQSADDETQEATGSVA